MWNDDLFEHMEKRSTEELEIIAAGLEEILINPEALLAFVRIKLRQIELILKYRQRYSGRR